MQKITGRTVLRTRISKHLKARFTMVKFTEAQTKAIETKGSDVLVSAAAGSGKTAVLVERIKQNIIEGNYSIDEVFVSTFTNKSAKDMKDKIERALRETYNETPDPRLKEEIIKLNDAHISTLHSFCLYLIQTHYNAIGLPLICVPSARSSRKSVC